MSNVHTHDLVIIGAGLAGMRAAFEGITAGLDTAVITKVHPLRSHSCAAQGGVNAALAKDDDWRDHAYDTVKGSDYIGDQDSIDAMCEEAPQSIRDLDDMGCPFSREEDGSISQRAFGGQSRDRTAYAADRTGHAMLHTLWEQTIKYGTHVYEEFFLLKICTDEETGRANGVVTANMKTGEIHTFRAKAILICTGGFGQLYASNTNALINTGDGLALSMRAGAAGGDLEFIQFHPTGLKSTGILISEGVRGEGAYLIGKDGKRFMHKYAPTKKELASRDVVSRSEITEIMNGNGVEGCVFLDVRHLGREAILEKLPQIRQLSIDYEGVDPIHEPIPIKPTCHYTMGGIRTNTHGMTQIEGLFAAGEAACTSVHGANRLGANSLLEAIVFGKITGKEAVRYIQNEGKGLPHMDVAEETTEQQQRLTQIKANPKKGGLRPADIKKELTEALDNYCNVFRTEKVMKKALKVVEKVKEDYKKVYIDDKSDVFNTDLFVAIELRNLIDLGECVVKGAIARKESRGAHTREEYPARDDENWMKHTLYHWNEDKEEMDISYEPVRTTGNERYTPKERVY